MFHKINISNLYVPFPLINVANKQLVPGKNVPMNEIKDKIIFNIVLRLQIKQTTVLLKYLLFLWPSYARNWTTLLILEENLTIGLPGAAISTSLIFLSSAGAWLEWLLDCILST